LFLLYILNLILILHVLLYHNIIIIFLHLYKKGA